MGLFSNLFGSLRHPKINGFWKTLTAYTPSFTTWRGDLYESELCRSAMDARARNISKLKIQVQGTAKPFLQTKLRLGPNQWQTWGQFLYRLSTILDMQNTAFIVPVLGSYGDVTGIYPILPSRCEIVDVSGEPWLRYKFSTGDVAAIELASVGIMTKYQYQDDFFGSSNTALNETMSLSRYRTKVSQRGSRIQRHTDSWRSSGTSQSQRMLRKSANDSQRRTCRAILTLADCCSSRTHTTIRSRSYRVRIR